jgi:hypothetical protein
VTVETTYSPVSAVVLGRYRSSRLPGRRLRLRAIPVRRSARRAETPSSCRQDEIDPGAVGGHLGADEPFAVDDGVIDADPGVEPAST